jgi:hypothetical protein
MSLSKETIVGKMEIVGPDKTLQIREDTVILEDGIELSRKFHRRTIHKGADVSGESLEIQNIFNAIHPQ